MIERLRARPRLFHIALAVLVIAGFVLRVWGNRFGLPFLYHEDEGEIVRRALRMPIDGPNPGWFQYPTLYVYVQALTYALLWLGSKVTGHATTYAAFADAATLDPTSVYAAGRTVTAAFGAATIAVVGAGARWLVSLDARRRDGAGLVAAALVTVELLQVEHAHYITADVPMTLAATGVLLVVGHLASTPDGGSVRGYALAGFLVGVAASIKYPGALFAVAVFVVWMQRQSWRTREDWFARMRDVRLPVAAASSLAGFVAGSPFVVLDWRAFARDFGAEAAHMREGHLGFELVQNHAGAMAANLAESGGIALGLLALAGVATVVWKRDAFGRSLALTLVVLIVFATSSNVLFARYLIPMLPVAALLAAHALVTVAAASARTREGIRTAVIATGLCVALALPGWLVLHRLALFTAPDTRTQSWTWVNENLRSPGDRIAVEWKSIPRTPLHFDVAESVPVVYDVGRLREAGVGYVAVTDRLYRRYLRAPDLYPQQAAFYRELLAAGEPAAAFSPFADESGRLALDDTGAAVVRRSKSRAPWSTLMRRERSGPVILVFRIGPQISTDDHRSDQ